MELKNKVRADPEAGLPADAKLIAKISPDGRHRTPSFGSKAIEWGGILGSTAALMWVEPFLEKKFGETPSKWRQPAAGDSEVKAFAKGVARIVDPNYIRSNLVAIAFFSPAIIGTYYWSKRVEENTFLKRYGNDPKFSDEKLAQVGINISR